VRVRFETHDKHKTFDTARQYSAEAGDGVFLPVSVTPADVARQIDTAYASASGVVCVFSFFFFFFSFSFFLS
jgi:hypothetical protein